MATARRVRKGRSHKFAQRNPKQGVPDADRIRQQWSQLFTLEEMKDVREIYDQFLEDYATMEEIVQNAIDLYSDEDRDATRANVERLRNLRRQNPQLLADVIGDNHEFDILKEPEDEDFVRYLHEVFGVPMVTESPQVSPQEQRSRPRKSALQAASVPKEPEAPEEDEILLPPEVVIAEPKEDDEILLPPEVVIAEPDESIEAKVQQEIVEPPQEIPVAPSEVRRLEDSEQAAAKLRRIAKGVDDALDPEDLRKWSEQLMKCFFPSIKV